MTPIDQPTLGTHMNEHRIKLAEAISARRRAAEARNQAQEALDRAGEYLTLSEAEVGALQARNQSEITAHGRNLIENFRAGNQGAALAETSTGRKLVDAERQFSAAAAAYGELERELAQACAAETTAEAVVRNAAAAVLYSVSDEIAKEVREHEKRAIELRENLRVINVISAAFHPSEKLRFLSVEAVDAMNWPLTERHVAPAARLQKEESWRTNFNALLADADHLLQP